MSVGLVLALALIFTLVSSSYLSAVFTCLDFLGLFLLKDSINKQVRSNASFSQCLTSGHGFLTVNC